MRIETAHKLLDEKYEEAKRLRYVRDKVAWAAYQVWREADVFNNVKETPDEMPDIHRSKELDAYIGAKVTVFFTDGTTCDGVFGYSDKLNLELGHRKGFYFLRRTDGDVIFRKSLVKKIERKWE